MPLIVYGQRVIEWVSERLGARIDPSCATAIGCERRGTLTAGVVFAEWNGQSVVCHWAISGPIGRDWLWYIHHYAFRELGAVKVIAPIWSDNVRMLRIARKMGFVEEGRLVNTQPNGDIVLFTLTADQSRYLGERYGEKGYTTAHT